MDGEGVVTSYGMYFVYILLLSNDQLYTGSSADLSARMKAHQTGKVASTARRRPVQLIHYEVYKLREDAERRERFLKSSEGKKLLKRQLSVLFRQLGIKQDDISLRP